MNPDIITFVDRDYIPVGRNWLESIRLVAPKGRICIVALDEETLREFSDVETLYRPLEVDGVKKLWIHRMEVFRELLEDGRDFIHSDADAIWLGDPLPSISQCMADMVFSQGTVWPPDIHDKHSIVLCCGLFYVRANSLTCSFFEEAAKRVIDDQDDQVTINRLIDEKIDGWLVRDGYWVAFKEKQFLASSYPIQPRLNSKERPETLPVAVLPHELFPRLVSALSPSMVVVHPLSGKTCEEKRETLGALGLWRAERFYDGLEI